MAITFSGGENKPIRLGFVFRYWLENKPIRLCCIFRYWWENKPIRLCLYLDIDKKINQSDYVYI